MANAHSQYALDLLVKLTLEEKIALVSGRNFMYTNKVPRLNIPSIRMSDGPHGLRVQKEGDSSITGSSSATCFPTSATSSNSWNVDLLKEMGSAIGEEARFYGIDVVLGPGINIKRNPLCGRNFEYFSEDPLLAGALATNEIKGIQSQGIGTSLKHFAFNNEENHRFMGNSLIDLRAAREIYLKPFEYAIKNAQPETVMNAYNKLNGVYCSENKWLLTDVLRNEWGFNGLVMTDWGATHNRIEGIKAGNDLEMPGDTNICRKWILDGINNGELDIKELDERVLNVLDLVAKHLNNNKLENINWENHHLLAARIAEESAVLLKNDDIFPLNKEEKLCVIGELFEKMRYQGSGSSMITSTQITTCKEYFDQKGIIYSYFKGYKENETKTSNTLIEEVIEGIKDFDKVILFIGLTDYEESEGGDRENMSLPNNQLELVNALLEKNIKIGVVLFGGSVVELPFFDKIDGLLNMFLPGQNGGEATYNILFGNVNPSGKLSETWPIKYSDVPFAEEFGKNKDTIYKESVYVGYRYYLTTNKEIRFPFGYGLSYTKYQYSRLIVEEKEKEIIAKATIKNIGKFKGKEIVQLYVEGPKTDFYKPLRELKGFIKIELNPNESKEVEFIIKKDDLRYWNLKEEKYSLEDGEYVIQIGHNSKDIDLEQIVNIKGENLNDIYEKLPQKVYKNLKFDEINDEIFEQMSGLKLPEISKPKPITLESSLSELRSTLIGKILYKAVMSIPNKDLKKAKKLPEGSEKDNRIKGALAVKKMLRTNSLIAMSMSSSGQFPYNYAEGFRDLSNWHIIRGIKDFTKKIEAPKLPIEEVK